jgi:hypothetical protein
MCRDRVIEDGLSFLEAYNDQLIDHLTNELNLAETHVGIDSQLGYQILQWAIEEAIANDVLAGSVFASSEDPLRLGSELPHVRTGLIGEPGGKYRNITIAPAWLTLLLTPFGHDLVKMLKDDPYCEAGLSKEQQGYRACSALFSSNFALQEDTFGIKGDLKTASDMMNHEFTRKILLNYVNSRGQLTDYSRICILLLTNGHRVRSPENSDISDFISTSGVFMGHPGCKGALTLTVLVCRTMARLVINHNNPVTSLSSIINNQSHLIPFDSGVDYFGRSAGDDFFELGKLPYLEVLCALLQSTGCIVGTKWVSKHFVTFCEEGILIRGTGIVTRHTNGGDKWLWMDRISYEETCHIDSVKLRLLSPCGKVSQGVTGQIENPAAGKGRQFRRMLENLPPFFKNFEMLFRKRWVFRMCNYINTAEVMTFLDPRMGGLGIPYHKPWTELAKMFAKSPWIKNKNYLSIMSSQISNTENWTQRIVNKLHKGCLSRGFSTSLADEAWSAYMLLAKGKLSVIKMSHLYKLDASISEFDWFKGAYKRNKVKMLYARSHGYLTEGNAQQLIEKAWVLKQGLLNPSGLFNPNNRHRRKYAEMEFELQNLDAEITSKFAEIEDKEGLQKRLLMQIVGLTNYARQDTLVIRENLLLQNFGGLRTPMPGCINNLAFCSGSVQDN